MTDRLDPLTASVRASLGAAGIDLSRIEVAATSDLRADGMLGESWLVVTEAELLAVDGAGRVVRRVLRNQVKSVQAESLVGGGAFVAEVAGDLIELTSYSNAHQDKFAYLVRWLSEWIDFRAGKRKEEPIDRKSVV